MAAETPGEPAREGRISAGMVIDGAAIIFIVTPIMLPVLKTLGIDTAGLGS